MGAVRWADRYGRHVRETAPYLLYAMRSGLGLTLFIVFLGGSYLYARWLADLPPDFPVVPVAALVLFPWIARSPVRTFLREEDSLFLLPMEHRLSRYFRSAWIFSMVRQSLLVTLVWLALWPLYRAGTGAGMGEWLLMLAAWIGLKAGCLWLSWRSARFVHDRSVYAFALFRLLGAAAAVYSFMAYPVARALPFVLLLCLLLAAAVRLPVSMPRNWLRMVEQERRAQSRMWRFYSWFVNVPGVTDRPIRRKWLDGAAERIRFSPDNVYRYFYLLLLLRTELAGMLVRILLVGMFAVSVLSREWAQLLAFALTALLLAVQGSTLGQAYRDADWMHVYPLPASQRHRSLARLMFTVHLLLSTLLAVCALFAMPVVHACLSWLCAAALSAIGHRMWRKRRERHGE